MQDKNFGDKKQDNERLIDDILNSTKSDNSDTDIPYNAVEETENELSTNLEIDDDTDNETVIESNENFPNEENLDNPNYMDESFDDENISGNEEVETQEEYNYSQVKIRKAPKQVRRPTKKKKSRSAKRTNKMAFALVRVTFIICTSIVLSVLLILLGKDFLGINKSDEKIIFEIPEGATTDEIAKLLEEENIIQSPQLFKFISKLKKADTLFQAGDHVIKPSMTYDYMINELIDTPLQKQLDIVTVTITEGMNLREAANVLAEKGVIYNVTDFIFMFNSGEFINPEKHKFAEYITMQDTKKFYAMEGYLFPDTYEFYKGDGSNISDEILYNLICTKIYDNFQKKIEPYLDEMQNKDLSFEELITLASIVQEEAPTKESMKMVASVFYNRLNNPEAIGRTLPFLESDPTSKYANEVVQQYIQTTSTSYIMVQAYDTYKTSGLPPGAICNPGLDAIEAVLNPADTQYYYFCSNINTKETYFATNLEEHNINLDMVQQQYAAQSEAEAQEAQ